MTLYYYINSLLLQNKAAAQNNIPSEKKNEINYNKTVFLTNRIKMKAKLFLKLAEL